MPGVREEPQRQVIQQQRRLPETEMDQVIKDYLAGTSAAAVGKTYGIDPQTVLNNLHARGITPRPANLPAIAGDDLERVITLRSEGWSYERIGREFGVSRVTVRNTLRRVGA